MSPKTAAATHVDLHHEESPDNSRFHDVREETFCFPSSLEIESIVFESFLSFFDTRDS